MGHQGGLHPEPGRLPPHQDADDGVGQGPQAPAPAVGQVGPGVDVLHGHGVDEGEAVDLRHAHKGEKEGCQQEARPGKEENRVETQGCQDAAEEDALQGDLRVAVRPGPQLGLEEDARQVADRHEDAHIRAGEAPVQDDDALKAREAADAAPEADL